MIKAIIIDDEESAISILKNFIEKLFPQFGKIVTTTNSVEGYQLIQTFRPDLIFLDIQMPRMDGFELLSQLPNLNTDVIFTTAYGHYAIKAIKFSALDYLLKPIDPEELKMALKKFFEKREEKKSNNILFQNFIKNMKAQSPNEKKLAIYTSEGLFCLHPDEIIRCQSDGNYTQFFLTDKRKLISSKTLKEYDNILSEYNFLRSHKSHLVNVNYINRLGSDSKLYLKNGDSVEVSRRKKEEVRHRLKM